MEIAEGGWPSSLESPQGFGHTAHGTCMYATPVLPASYMEQLCSFLGQVHGESSESKVRNAVFVCCLLIRATCAEEIIILSGV